MIIDDFTNFGHHSKHHHPSSIPTNQSPSPATSTTTTTTNHQQPSQHRILNHSPDTSPSHLLLLGWIWSGRSTTATVWTSSYTLTFDPARLRPCQASSSAEPGGVPVRSDQIRLGEPPPPRSVPMPLPPIPLDLSLATVTVVERRPSSSK
ncbi:hypothetical protein M6B38_126060 [Iris pallida]|uniref:Uncharacterized protein n=1 Tax=Iris pallida TaxID=29817 RepID=A0AAX6GP48_IRIPA|nr:hypothetical protein M6B38_126060 [Iris pallida]